MDWNNGPLINADYHRLRLSIFYLLSSIYTLSYSFLSILYLSISYSSLVSPLFINPHPAIVPGRQNTVWGGHGAPDGDPPPPHDGILPAMPLFLRPELGICFTKG
jgi:hypothetical protein